MINVRIETENEAFQDGNWGIEVARILKKIAKDFEETESSRASYNDINGNKVAFLERT